MSLRDKENTSQPSQTFDPASAPAAARAIRDQTRRLVHVRGGTASPAVALLVCKVNADIRAATLDGDRTLKSHLLLPMRRRCPDSRTRAGPARPAVSIRGCEVTLSIQHAFACSRQQRFSCLGSIAVLPFGSPLPMGWPQCTHVRWHRTRTPHSSSNLGAIIAEASHGTPSLAHASRGEEISPAHCRGRQATSSNAARKGPGGGVWRRWRLDRSVLARSAPAVWCMGVASVVVTVAGAWESLRCADGIPARQSPVP